MMERLVSMTSINEFMDMDIENSFALLIVLAIITFVIIVSIVAIAIYLKNK